MTTRLLTIPISHFCEKARWALDRAGIAYTEEGHLQVIHIWKARRAGGGQTVPVLVADGEVMADSTAIIEWVDRRLPATERLYPDHLAAEVHRLEAGFDAGLGPDGRLWMYHETLPVIKAMAPWALAGIPAWERRVFNGGSRLMNPIISRYLGVTPTAASVALANVYRTYDEVAAQLADGRPFLTGNRFTAADLTFAALSAPVLCPAEYGLELPPLDVLPASMTDEVRLLREHPAGVFGQRLFAQERHRRVQSDRTPA